MRRLFVIALLAVDAFAQQRIVEMARYKAVLESGDLPALTIYSEGENVFRFPIASGLSTADQEEKLTDIHVTGFTPGEAGANVLTATASSSLWTERRFVWRFLPDHVEFQQFAKGDRPIGRCYFFSNGISERWDNGTSPGVASNTTIYADRYFSARVNHADQQYFTIPMAQSIGVASETEEGPAYDPSRMDGLFVPPPLDLIFHRGRTWTSVGIGAKAGDYLFNGLEYSGSRYAGASFWINRQGRATAHAGYASPIAALHFGYDEFAAMANYVKWIDDNGFSTQHRFPVAAWHRLPIFCGWAEQTVEARLPPREAHDLATQQKYEEWISVLEKRGLSVGTIVVDDKWQKHYGTFDVDEEKWPDMQGFIARQHAKNRHVLLWVPAYHLEGLPVELCIRRNGKPVAGDASNPRYESFLRQQIKHLVNDLGVDGFKEDWIGGFANFSDLDMSGPLYGIEFLRRFQFILHDEAHRWKPDALVETQTPNPLFRESSDVLRLNDIWYGARDVTANMRLRARIAWVAGWPLVDCDNASSTNLEEWWNYMQAQPSIGIPALYFVYRTESTKELVPEENWRRLKAIWNEYVSTLAPSGPASSVTAR